MLIRDTTLSTPDQWYDNASKTNPGTLRTSFDSFAAGFATPAAFAVDLSDTLAKTPEGTHIRNMYNALSSDENIPNMGYGQEAMNYISNMVGYGLNPITWLGGAIGGALGGAAIRGVSALAPEAASAFMRTPLALMGDKTLSQLAENTTKGFATASGAAVPQAVTANYDQDADHINWLGAARSMGEMGSVGIAISSIPFAWGFLKGRVNRGRVEPEAEVSTNDIDDALKKGTITSEQAKWLTDYKTQDLSDPAVKDALQKQATEILAKEGHQVDTVNNEVPVTILDSKTMDNLKNALPDQLTTNVPDELKPALTDFIMNNGIDQFKDNPKMLDGIKGYVDFIKDRLDKKSEKLAEADKIVDEHLTKSMTDNMDFSQKKLFKMIKQSGFDEGHAKSLPLTMPDNIVRRLNQLKASNDLNAKSKKYLKLYEKTKNKKYLERINNVNDRVKEIESNLSPILTPKEELMQLRKSLLSEKGLETNYKNSRDYQRLVDLAHVWHNAKTLLDRVHLEDEYNKQEAFKNLFDGLIKISESPLKQLANKDNVMDYLKARLEKRTSNTDVKERIEETKQQAKTVNEIPKDVDKAITDYREQVENSKAENLKKEAELSDIKFEQFKNAKQTLSNFITCVMGALNG